MSEADRIDWLARKVGGVINLRLESDPEFILMDTLTDRRNAYLRQCLAVKPNSENRRVNYPASKWRGLFGFVQDDE